MPFSLWSVRCNWNHYQTHIYTYLHCYNQDMLTVSTDTFFTCIRCDHLEMEISAIFPSSSVGKHLKLSNLRKYGFISGCLRSVYKWDQIVRIFTFDGWKEIEMKVKSVSSWWNAQLNAIIPLSGTFSTWMHCTKWNGIYWLENVTSSHSILLIQTAHRDILILLIIGKGIPAAVMMLHQILSINIFVVFLITCFPCSM